MNSSFKDTLTRLGHRIKDAFKALMQRLGRIFTGNVGLKAAAFVFALLLWAYVLVVLNPVRTKYIEGVTVPESKIRLTAECEDIEGRERMGEYIMLRLRLAAGIDDREFSRRFGFSFERMYGEKCRFFVQNGFMTVKNGVFALTPSGMFISNYILTEILEFADLGRFNFT